VGGVNYVAAAAAAAADDDDEDDGEIQVAMNGAEMLISHRAIL